MKSSIWIITIILITFFQSFAQVKPVFFISDPSLSPDGKTIVFSYESDLWKVDANGGAAYRITALDGIESLPRYSPDGQWIAFTSTQDNNPNVYVMPANGGDIKQLTWFDAEDLVDSWSWDSKYIYFASSRYNMISEYRVAVTGGSPVRLFSNYHNNPHHMVQHPQTGAYIFTESWESQRFPTRKRYKGDHNPDIESYNPNTKEFKMLTTYNGKDMWPATDQKGNLYYASDQANNEYNLYTLENNVPKQLTNFKTSIRRPQVSANGQKIVFVKDYQLNIYDVNLKSAKKVELSINSYNTLQLHQNFNVNGRISYYDVSSDNKKIAFISRGELFVSDIEGKFVKKMEINPEERALEVKWFSDNVTLLYTRTVNGWANLFTLSADGKSKEKQLTDFQTNCREIRLNGKRNKCVYLCGRNDVNLLDLNTLKSETLLKEELWGFQNSTPQFSPNDEYVLFTAYRNFEQDIFIYSLNSKQKINLTNTGVTEDDPFWSPDGKYIYFASNRFKENYPRGQGETKLFRLPLYKFSKEFKNDEYKNLFLKNPAKSDSIIVIRIDTANMPERWEQIPVSNGQQSGAYVIVKKDETTILFASNHDKGENALWKMVLKPFEQPKTEKLGTRTGSKPFIVQAKDNYYVLSGGVINKINLSANKLEEIKIEYAFSRQLKNEFRQMFYETWATLQENFYDEKFHGIDWSEMKNEYEKYLPFILQRDNLRVLLNDMLGELNSSHMGFSSIGEEERPFYNARTMFPGVMFNNDDPYKVDDIVLNGKLDLTDQPVKPGDILTAVNGKTIDPLMPNEYYFTAPGMTDELQLTFKRINNEFTVNVTPQSTGSLGTLLYEEWTQNNQNYVDTRSGKRIAYIHMKAMGDQDLEKFIIEMTSEWAHRDALILDIRYNRGGNIHDDVLNFLAQRPYLQWKYREGKLTLQPNFAPTAKPIVLLINEHSLSDAEMTAEGFKTLKLGTVIGTETYRWIIFTSGKGLVDGSFVRVPAWGCYTLNGKDLESTGVSPDIYVKTTLKDRQEGKDPQLDKAIEVIMKQLK